MTKIFDQNFFRDRQLRPFDFKIYTAALRRYFEATHNKETPAHDPPLHPP